jgi:hypothetical protein
MMASIWFLWSSIWLSAALMTSSCSIRAGC